MKRAFAIPILILWMAVLGAGSVKAPTQAGQITVILILDNSGSMRTSDPGGLRYTGVRLFASLLDVGDSLGLVIFSSQAKTLTDGLATINSQADKKNILGDLNIEDANGYTDVKAAFEHANLLLRNADLRDQKVVIVFLTDGKPETPNPYSTYEAETLELARSLHVPVMAIALTTAAQTPFLDQLAGATNGDVFPVEEASDLLNAYLWVFGQIKDRTVIGGKTFQTTGSLEVEPALAPYIQSVSFVVAKPQSARFHLLGPDGRDITATSPSVTFSDSSDPRFSILTLKYPVGGNYSFRLQGGGPGRVWAILHSRLRLDVIEPVQIHPLGREMFIVINLLEEKTAGSFTRIIGEANFTAQIKRPDGSEVSLDRFYDDGTHGDAVASDGNYTRLYPQVDIEGTYLISIQGWKNAVPVHAEARVNVVPFPELVLDAPLESMELRGQNVPLQVHLEGGNPSAFDQGEVAARVVSPSGQVKEITLHGDGVYAGEFLPVEDGEYQVLFETLNVTYRGAAYSTSLSHSFHVSLIPFVEVKANEANIPSSCFSAPEEIVLSLMVTSSGQKTLSFFVPYGWQVLPETVKVHKGEQILFVRLFENSGLHAGSKSVEVLIEGGDRLDVLPEERITIEYQYPTFWTRCRTPIRLGGGLFVLVLVGGVAFRHSRKAALPPPVGGTLRHWPAGGTPAQSAEVDLTAYGKPALLIGSGVTCDVIIPASDLDPEHARLVAQRSSEGLDMVLEPIGKVLKGYGLQLARFALRHGEIFRMGSHEFQFLSDHGD